MNLSANVSKLPNGEYLVYLASKSTLTGKEELEWQRARCVEGTTNYYTLTIRDGNYTINKGKGNLTTALDSPTLVSQILHLLLTPIYIICKVRRCTSRRHRTSVSMMFLPTAY